MPAVGSGEGTGGGGRGRGEVEEGGIGPDAAVLEGAGPAGEAAVAGEVAGEIEEEAEGALFAQGAGGGAQASGAAQRGAQSEKVGADGVGVCSAAASLWCRTTEPISRWPRWRPAWASARQW